MGRKFFDSKRKHFGSQGKKSYGPCARCGKGHDTKFCPQKAEASGNDTKSFKVEEHSEFIYGQLWSDDGPTGDRAPSADEAVTAGFGALDAGGLNRKAGRPDQDSIHHWETETVATHQLSHHLTMKR